MMCSSIAGLWTEGQMWKYTESTSKMSLRSFASISCTPISRRAYFPPAKYHFMGASWVIIAYGPARKEQGDHRLAGAYQRKRTSKVPWLSGVAAHLFAQLRQDYFPSLSFIDRKRTGYGILTVSAPSKLIKKRLIWSPGFAIEVQDRPFHVVLDASYFAIGCAITQYGVDRAERIVCYQWLHLQPAERTFSVHDKKEPLAMKYALAKFKFYLLGN